ncbi:MAG: hypothetical protein BAJALOKI3v1_160048 [Promethearchaeota archaeon]|jgi:hypothetical protein|nr:MAG: hypothetical protein BAJALOKI3v1_160048 [Candidatus Lokiarchaeota archaeon]
MKIRFLFYLSLLCSFHNTVQFDADFKKIILVNQTLLSFIANIIVKLLVEF